MDSDFSDLLSRAKQLTADVDTGTELPRIERNIPQLAEASQRLLSKTRTTVGESSDIKASLLLSSKGVELPKLSQRLESLNTTKTFEPVEPVIETDIAGFLKNERENAILSIIEETKQKTFEFVENNFWESLEDEWEKEKQKILNSLLGAGKQAMSFPADASRIEEFNVIKGRSSLSAVEMSYARQIFMCNEASIHGEKINFVDALKQVGLKNDDTNVKDIWLLIEQLLIDLPKHEKNSKKLRHSKEFQMKIIQNAQLFLENRYRDFIESYVYSNLQQAQLGGIPGLFNLVQSYLKIKMQKNMIGYEDGMINGVPVWPLLFYCLRCGSIDATEQAAEALPPQFSEFKLMLKEYLSSVHRRLHPNNEAKLRLQYKRTIRSCTDPFKRAVFCIIGQCDSSDTHPEVINKTEDYIWLKLNQISFSDEDLSNQETTTLSALQKLLSEEYGESHFKAYDQPYLYCQVLFLTAQFETGVEFLSRLDHCRTHAVHIAAVLNHENILLKPDVIHTPLLTTDPLDQGPIKRLNYARLITIYTRKFEITDPREALEYFYLLRNINGPTGDNLFATCVSELALESREFETILGCINADGTKKPGCVSKFKLDVSSIVSIVAKDAEAKGQFEDAVMLNDLSDNHDKVLEILGRLLSQHVALPNTPQSSRERLQILSRSIAERYKMRGHSGSRHRSATFYLLIDLMYFFDLYHEKQFDEALTVMERIRLIPTSVEEVEAKVMSFKQYSDEIRQCLSEVLLTTITMLYEKYKKYKTSTQKNMLGIVKDKDETFLTSLRNNARALVTFAGLLPYRMPGDTNARLVQLEVMMN